MRKEDGRYQVIPLNEVRISNQVGASTLAVSDDGYIVIVYQNKYNQESKNKLAPSGSGSLDWADVGEEQHDLLSIIEGGAKRELDEECALDDAKDTRPKICSKVRTLGYARLFHRAGKPEFYLIGRIFGEAAKIIERDPEFFVEQVCYNINSPRVDLSAPQPSKAVGELCEYLLKARILSRDRKFKVPWSYPLQQAMQILREACKDPECAEVIDTFLCS